MLSRGFIPLKKKRVKTRSDILQTVKGTQCIRFPYAAKNKIKLELLLKYDAFEKP